MKKLNKLIIEIQNNSKESIQPKLISRKRSNAKLPIGLKLAANTAAQLTDKAMSMHLSRNALMSMAIERCLKEDVWRIGDGTCVARNIAANPDSRLVDLSNLLLSMSFIADKLMVRNSKKQRDELVRICQDAKTSLKSLRSSLGC
jgi:hypothetical protein